MIQIYNSPSQKKIRLSPLLSLIFFACVILCSCRQGNQDEITVIWNNDRATALAVPKSLIKDNSVDSLKTQLQVSLASNPSIPMLGDYAIIDDKIIFTPVIPFTRGLTYEVFFHHFSIGKILIPTADQRDAPIVKGIYPTQDTLPENLLKVYIEFSGPMQEGQSPKHVHLVNHNHDTLAGVFLDLQPELWDKERTVLTLWLDPGRVKRELIPNRLLGSPLKKGEYYTLVVSSNWKDVKGLGLSQPFSKKFFVGERDNTSPAPGKWNLHLPDNASLQPLQADAGESLDHFLLLETIMLFDGDGNQVKGKIQLSEEERKFLFVPELPWQPGSYTLSISSYLEDLAGNNLNRLFDRDIRIKQENTEKEIFERRFEIK